MGKRRNFFCILIFSLILALSLSGTLFGAEEKEFWELCKEGTREEIYQAIKDGADVNKGDQKKEPLSRMQPDTIQIRK